MSNHREEIIVIGHWSLVISGGMGAWGWDIGMLGLKN
jgi:hypothetical protein